VGGADKPRLQVAEAGSEERREEEENEGERKKAALGDVVVLKHAREREVEEENAHSEFEEHGEDKPGEADREESASREASKPGDEEIDGHENQKRAGEDADLPRRKIADAGNEKNHAQGAVEEFDDEENEPGEEGFGEGEVRL
jgi:hypothetical protein